MTLGNRRWGLSSPFPGRNTMASVLVAEPLSKTDGSNVSAVSWAAALAGGVVIAALTLVLLAFGAGMGFAAVSPWSTPASSAATAPQPPRRWPAARPTAAPEPARMIQRQPRWQPAPSPLEGEGWGGGWLRARCLRLPPSLSLPLKGGGNRASRVASACTSPRVL